MVPEHLDYLFHWIQLAAHRVFRSANVLYAKIRETFVPGRSVLQSNHWAHVNRGN